MAICPNCGTENPDGSRVCSECNQPLPAGDTVRCPMCSRPNPADAAVCEHCGARLRPMTAEDLEAGEPSPPPSPPPATPVPPVEARAPAPSAPLGDDAEGGLRSIFSASGEEDDSFDTAGDEGEETPSWLSRLEDEGEREIPAESHAEAPSHGDELPGRLGQPPAEEPEVEPGEMPSWLQPEAEEKPSPTAREDFLAGPPADEGEAKPEEEKPMPEWLQGVAAGAPVAGGGEDEMPSWLQPEAEEKSSPTAREDFLAGPPADEEEAKPEEEEPMPAWPQGGPAESPVAVGGEDNMPDWLRDLPSESSAEREEAEEILSWLQDVPVEPTTAAEAKEAMPDWLQDVVEGPSAVSEEPGIPAPPVEERAPEPLPEAEEAPALPEQKPLEESVPPWLEDEGAAKGVEEPLGEALPSPGTSPLVPAEEMTLEDKDLLNLLAELDEEEPEVVEEQPDIAIERAELPEWLRSQRPSEIEEMLPSEEEEAPGVFESELAAAKPKDIEDLRFEAILGKTGAEEPHPELAGALKDVRGVLKPEPIFIAPQPEKIIEDVVVTEEQARRIEAVRSALAAEHEGAILEGLRRRAFPIERWLTTLLVLAAIIVPIVGGFQPMPAPQTRSLAVREVMEVVDALPEGSRVLLAFEYEPDTAGELDVAVEAVVAHLMSHEAYFYAISTRTTGRDVAQHVLTDVTSGHADYAYGERWFNLGYLAGRPVGLRRLALGAYVGGVSPLVRDYRGNPTGLAPDDLYHFDAIVVFAARPEEVRDWVEQVGQATDMPMVAVVSASAAPVVYPYEQSGQLAGVINGFSDAITYSVSTQAFSSEMATRWNAQALASLAAAALILGSGIFHGLMVLRRRSEQTQ